MLRNKLLVIGFTVVILTLAACAAPAAAPVVEQPVYVERSGVAVADEYTVEGAEAAPEAVVAQSADVAQAVEKAAEQGGQRLIIRTGYLSLVVEDTRETKKAIEAMVAEMAGEGAFVVSSNESGSGDPNRSPYISMSIRVPATRFDEAMDRIASMAVQVNSRNESGEDVTEEYVDLEARLESLEAARERLLEIMANAQTTEELLQAEQQLTQREAEIESIKGRMQYLSEAARLSSINIELQPYILTQPVDTTWKPAETVRRAFDDLVRSLRGFGDFVLYSSIACLPWLLVAGVVIFGIVRLVMWRVRVRRERRAAASAQQQES